MGDPGSQAAAGGNDGMVAYDLHCVRCGYCVRGLGTGARCPECDLPVRESVAAARSVAAHPTRGVTSGARLLALSAQVMLLTLGAGYALTVAQRMIPPEAPDLMSEPRPLADAFNAWHEWAAPMVGLGILAALVVRAVGVWRIAGPAVVDPRAPSILHARVLARAGGWIAVLGWFVAMRHWPATLPGSAFAPPPLLSVPEGDVSVVLARDMPSEARTVGWLAWCIFGPWPVVLAFGLGRWLERAALRDAGVSLPRIAKGLWIGVPVLCAIGLLISIGADIQARGTPPPRLVTLAEMLTLAVLLPLVFEVLLWAAGVRLYRRLMKGAAARAREG